MDYLETANYLKDFLPDGDMDLTIEKDHEAIVNAIEALGIAAVTEDFNTPKTPIHYYDEDGREVTICPQCESDLRTALLSRYCPECGQKLDWSYLWTKYKQGKEAEDC